MPRFDLNAVDLVKKCKLGKTFGRRPLRQCLKKVGKVPWRLMKKIKTPFKKAGIYHDRGNTVKNMQGFIDALNKYLGHPVTVDKKPPVKKPKTEHFHIVAEVKVNA